jgi:dCTP deaminase
MVLSDADVLGAIRAGELGIEPFVEKSLTPNGYDISIESILIPKFGVKTTEGAVPVPPQTWFVASSRETVRLGNSVTAQLWLRSTFARQGILATFGKVDAGFRGTLTITAFNSSSRTVDISVEIGRAHV